MVRRMGALAAATVLALTACTAAPPRAADPPAARPAPDEGPGRRRQAEPEPVVGAPAPRVREVRLHAIGACDDFLGHMRSSARRMVGPWGLGGGGATIDDPVPMLGSGASGAALASAEVAPQPPPAYSGTNVQEAGVDEPDLVKTDGRRIFSLVDGRLRAVELRKGDPILAGTLDLPGTWGNELLLAGDRVLVLGWGEHPSPRDRASTVLAHSSARATVRVIDVSDPSDLRLVRTVTFEGDLVSARLVGGAARVVVASRPDSLRFTWPRRPGRAARGAAVRRNRAIVERAPLEAWLPGFVVSDRRGRGVASGRMSCDRMLAPPEPSGLGVLAVHTVDPATGAVKQGDAVLGDAGTVYASASSLYATTSRWREPEARRRAGRTTLIHRFDISSPEGARYRSSGAVDGHLLSQWSISEHDGHLRLATTLDRGGGEDESAVTVLAERAGLLVRVGYVDGIGKGERIFGVRFIGALGYVVTFRQIDPLHVVDLSDPARPRVRGELEIPGYSSYLHPAGDGLLLGIGQDADADGVTTGTQVSLFDVSDPERPRRVDRLHLGTGSSHAEWDHHAFLWWPATSTAVLPLQLWEEPRFNGAVAIRVAGRRLEEAGRLTHERAPGPGGDYWDWFDWRAEIRRSLVAGDELYTVSSAGVLASRLDDLEERAWLGWPMRLERVSTYAGSSRGARDGWTGDARFDDPAQMALDHRGAVYVADRGNSAVRRIVDETVSTIPLSEDDPPRPTGVAVAADGSLVVATGCALLRVQRPRTRRPTVEHLAGDSIIRCAIGSGAAPAATDGSGPAGAFAETAQIAVARDGAIIVADRGAHAIRRVTVGEDGQARIETIAGRLGSPGAADGAAADARLRSPEGVAVLPNGDIVVGDAGNGSVRRIRGGVVATIARLGDGAAPSGVVYEPGSGTVLVADPAGNAIWVVRDGRAERIAGSRAGFRDGPVARARFREPTAIAVLSSAGLLVADSGNDRLRTLYG